MTLLLDTNVCIAYLNGTDEAVRERLLACRPDSVRLCSVVKAELLFGARNSARIAENLRRLESFFTPFQSLSFDDAAAIRYSELRAQLVREGRPIGANDMLIAAIALTNGCTLVTRNTGEFARVEGLKLETW